MSDIKSSGVAAGRVSHAMSFESFNTEDSAWKKELEKQMYEKNTPQSIGDGFVGQDVLAGMKERAEPVSEGFISNVNGATSEEQRFKENPIKGVPVSSVEQQSVERASTKQTIDLFHHVGLDVGRATQVVSNYKLLDEVLVENNSSSKEVMNAVEKKELSIKILADGEVVIRNYLTAPHQKINLNGLVEDLKTILGRDISKLKVNGELVWETNSKTRSVNEANYKVNLIF